MIFDSALRAFRRLFTAPFRSMLWKSLSLTLLLLILTWFLLRHIFILYFWPMIEGFLPGFPSWLGWLGIVAIFMLSLSLIFILTLFVTPITAFIGSFFIDQAVEIIEKEDFPGEAPGEALPLDRALILSFKFLFTSLLGNILLLPLLFFPFAHLIGFYILNAYLLGKEYFVLNALRFHSEANAYKFYRKHKNLVLASGFIITLFLSIPIFNFLTPIFAAIMMTYLYKTLEPAPKLYGEDKNRSNIKHIIYSETEIDILPPEKKEK